MHSFKRNHIWFKRNWSYLQIKRWITWISKHSRRVGCVRVAEAIPWYDLFFHCSMHIFQVIHYIKSTGIHSKYWYLFFAYMYKAISQLNTFAMAIVSCFTHSLLYPFSASPFPSFVNFQLRQFPASIILSFTSSKFHQFPAWIQFSYQQNGKLLLPRINCDTIFLFPSGFIFLPRNVFFYSFHEMMAFYSSFHFSPNSELTRKFTIAKTW